MSYCYISNKEHLVKEIKRGHVIGCAFCNTEFDKSDKERAKETFKCPHCGREMWRGLVQVR